MKWNQLKRIAAQRIARKVKIVFAKKVNAVMIASALRTAAKNAAGTNARAMINVPVRRENAQKAIANVPMVVVKPKLVAVEALENLSREAAAEQNANAKAVNAKKAVSANAQKEPAASESPRA